MLVGDHILACRRREAFPSRGNLGVENFVARSIEQARALFAEIHDDFPLFTMRVTAEAELAAHSVKLEPETPRSPLLNAAKTLLPPALLLG